VVTTEALLRKHKTHGAELPLLPSRNVFSFLNVLNDMKKIVLINTILLLFLHFSFAQNANNQSVKSDTTPSVKTAISKAQDAKTDTVPASKKIGDKKNQASVDSFPIPKMAALWSILPGGGQIYNKKWAFIKVPIVYGALVTTISLTAFNQKQYKKYKQADYNLRNPVDPKKPLSGFSDIPNTTNTTRLREIRDAYFKTTQQMYIFTGVTYLLAAAEAFTSAHLAHFDVSDELSFRVKPSFEPVGVAGNAFGLGVQLKF
jgi:Family of unknown function (DUF5683)